MSDSKSFTSSGGYGPPSDAPPAGFATSPLAFFLKTANISIVSPDLVFLDPPSSAEAIAESTLSGQISLYLAVPRVIYSLTVSLLGQTDVGFVNGAYESANVMKQEITLPLPLPFPRNSLPAGNYDFPFSFSITGTAAPSERTRFGRTQYRIIAKAKGAGMMGKTTLVEKTKRVHLVPNAGQLDSQRDLALNFSAEDISDTIGAYRLVLNSVLFTVAGLLAIQVAFFGPLEQTTIHSIVTVIQQSFSLRSPRRKFATGEPFEERPPTQRVVVTRIDRRNPPLQVASQASMPEEAGSGDCTKEQWCKRDGPLVVLEPGQGWDMRHYARLPNDDVIRGSTPLNNDTLIRVSHALSVEIIYTLASKPTKRQILTITRPVSLISCCCVKDSVVLPLYTQKASSDCRLPDAGVVPDFRYAHCTCKRTEAALKKEQDVMEFFAKQRTSSSQPKHMKGRD